MAIDELGRHLVLSAKDLIAMNAVPSPLNRSLGTQLIKVAEDGSSAERTTRIVEAMGSFAG